MQKSKVQIKNQNTILSLKNVSVAYYGVPVLRDVSLDIVAGEFVALMGPNGAGKSTILKAIFGLVPNFKGTVEWNGEKVHPIPHEMSRYGIALVPQGRRVFTHLTIRENLEVGGLSISNKLERTAGIERVLRLFPQLKSKEKKYAGILSGGEQQMLAIARALIIDPELLLLDEPTLGLAPKIVGEVFEKMKEINDEYNTTILVVEHNIKSILNLANRAYLLDKGEIIQQGTSQQLLKGKTLQNVLLGS